MPVPPRGIRVFEARFCGVHDVLAGWPAVGSGPENKTMEAVAGVLWKQKKCPLIRTLHLRQTDAIVLGQMQTFWCRLQALEKAGLEGSRVAPEAGPVQWRSYAVSSVGSCDPRGCQGVG